MNILEFIAVDQRILAVVTYPDGETTIQELTVEEWARIVEACGGESASVEE